MISRGIDTARIIIHLHDELRLEFIDILFPLLERIDLGFALGQHCLQPSREICVTRIYPDNPAFASRKLIRRKVRTKSIENGKNPLFVAHMAKHAL